MKVVAFGDGKLGHNEAMAAVVDAYVRREKPPGVPKNQRPFNLYYSALLAESVFMVLRRKSESKICRSADVVRVTEGYDVTVL